MWTTPKRRKPIWQRCTMRMTQTIGDPAQLAMVPEGRQEVLPPVRGREEMPTVGVGEALRRNPSRQENETVECVLLTHEPTWQFRWALQEKVGPLELTLSATQWYNCKSNPIMGRGCCVEIVRCKERCCGRHCVRSLECCSAAGCRKIP